MSNLYLSTVALLTVSVMFAASARAGEGKAELGQPAPAFSLQDQSGKTVSLSDYAGKVVVLEWFNEQCPFVVKHYKTGNMNNLASKYAEQDVVWLAINTTQGKTNEDNAAIAKEWNIERPILNDSKGEVGQSYGATNTPHMFVIDKAGNLAYMGAIDDRPTANPDDIPSSTNHVAKALDEVLAGKEVSTPKTKAYGCSVKYPE